MAHTDQQRGWQVKKTLRQTNQYMLDNHIACDFKFIIHSPDGSTAEIVAHKFMLVSRSPVFEAMLCGPVEYIETSETIVTDVEPDILQEMLKYIYTEMATITTYNVLHLLVVSKKYLLDGLTDRCTKFLEFNITADNVCTIFNHSVIQEDEIIKQHSLDFISNNMSEILSSDDFLQMSQSALQELLKCDNLVLESEAMLYEACIQWAKYNATDSSQTDDEDVRNILGDCVFQFRFLSMSSVELGETLLRDKQLWSCYLPPETKDVKDYTTYACRNNTGLTKHLVDVGFNSSPRSTKQTQSYCIHRFKDSREMKYLPQQVYSRGIHSISFTVSRHIKLTGISMFARHEGMRHKYTMDIIEQKSDKILSHNYGVLSNTGTNIHYIHIPITPVELHPKVLYTIQISLDPNSTRLGLDGMHVVSEAGITFTFYKGPSSETITSVNQGQIPKLHFTRL